VYRADNLITSRYLLSRNSGSLNLLEYSGILQACNGMAMYLIYLLTAIGLTAGGRSTVHIYTETIHRKTQLTNWEECGPCPAFASYTLTFALQIRKNHEKTSVMVAEDCQLTRRKQNITRRKQNIAR
jgi:uncharacterized integral membrane protein